MDALKINNIWRGTGEQMAKPGMTGADWKKKWKNIVDAKRKYTKKMKQKKSGDSAKPVRAYKFAGILSFLEKYKNEDITESNVTPLSAEQSDAESWKDSMERSTLSGDDEFNDIDMDSESVISMSSSRSEQRRGMTQRRSTSHWPGSHPCPPAVLNNERITHLTSHNHWQEVQLTIRNQLKRLLKKPQEGRKKGFIVDFAV